MTEPKPFCNGPFTFSEQTFKIYGVGKDGHECHVLDVRGWGYLTGGGHGALGIANEDAPEFQRDTGRWVVDALNAAWNAKVNLANGEKDGR